MTLQRFLHNLLELHNIDSRRVVVRHDNAKARCRRRRIMGSTAATSNSSSSGHDVTVTPPRSPLRWWSSSSSSSTTCASTLSCSYDSPATGPTDHDDHRWSDVDLGRHPDSGSRMAAPQRRGSLIMQSALQAVSKDPTIICIPPMGLYPRATTTTTATATATKTVAAGDHHHTDCCIAIPQRRGSLLSQSLHSTTSSTSANSPIPSRTPVNPPPLVTARTLSPPPPQRIHSPRDSCSESSSSESSAAAAPAEAGTLLMEWEHARHRSSDSCILVPQRRGSLPEATQSALDVVYSDSTHLVNTHIQDKSANEEDVQSNDDEQAEEGWGQYVQEDEQSNEDLDSLMEFYDHKVAEWKRHNEHEHQHQHQHQHQHHQHQHHQHHERQQHTSVGPNACTVAPRIPVRVPSVCNVPYLQSR